MNQVFKQIAKDDPNTCNRAKIKPDTFSSESGRRRGVIFFLVLHSTTFSTTQCHVHLLHNTATHPTSGNCCWEGPEKFSTPFLIKLLDENDTFVCKQTLTVMNIFSNLKILIIISNGNNILKNLLMILYSKYVQENYFK